jgi:hypothetical protein
MAASALNLFKIVTAPETSEMMDRLELTRPPSLSFENRTEMSEVYQSLSPAEWTVGEIWVPSPASPFPDARLISTAGEFTPDFFLLSYEFFSNSLRNIMAPFAEYIEYFDVDAAGSCDAFLEKDYKMAVFTSLSPFDRVFSEVAMEHFAKGEYPPKLPVRDDFDPVAPIFNLATGPWLMCTEEVVAEIMPFSVGGLTFINYETDEVLIPGLQ